MDYGYDIVTQACFCCSPRNLQRLEEYKHLGTYIVYLPKSIRPNYDNYLTNVQRYKQNENDIPTVSTNPLILNLNMNYLYIYIWTTFFTTNTDLKRNHIYVNHQIQIYTTKTLLYLL